MFSQRILQSIILLAIGSLSFSIFAPDAKAQNNSPFEPLDQPAPTITIGGGRRSSDGKCPKDRDVPSADRLANDAIEQRLTPLLPTNKLGLTTLANPTFFAYVPKTSAIAVEFTLENQQGRGLYQQRVNLTNSPAIISFQLPTTTALEVGKDYKWLVSVVCESGDPEDTFSEGIVRRIQLSTALIGQLDRATASDRVALYTKFGIWHEALADMAKLRLSQPSNTELQGSWQNLLKASGLEALAKVPLKN
jgi:hypothetical protein